MAAKLTKPHISKLTAAIRTVIESSILQSGTTLWDFLHSDGSPGYFGQSLTVFVLPAAGALQRTLSSL